MRHGKDLDIVVCTNLALATDEMFRYFRDEGVDISTSLDGPAFIHNANRPRPGGDSHELAVRNIARARDFLGVRRVAALMTTTKLSLEHPIEIIDEYLRLGFRSIFLRSLSAYGFALRTRGKTGYEMDRFLDFYRKGLAYILDLNRRGTDFVEAYATIILTKIMTPFPVRFVDLQSPAGAGISNVKSCSSRLRSRRVCGATLTAIEALSRRGLLPSLRGFSTPKQRRFTAS